jgi:hypothetical protein
VKSVDLDTSNPGRSIIPLMTSKVDVDIDIGVVLMMFGTLMGLGI